MYTCIFFKDDFTLTVVATNDKGLQKDGEIELKRTVRMKWDGRTYTGIVVKMDESKKFLDFFAQKVDEEILENRQSRPADEILEDILDFGESFIHKSDSKRKPKPTCKAVESREQEGELSPKKKKKSEKSDSRDEKKNNQPAKKKAVNAPKQKEKEKTKSIISTNISESSEILDQFLDVPGSKDLGSNDKTIHDDTTLTETWSICQGKRRSAPKPSASTLKELKQLLPLLNHNLREYLTQLLDFVQDTENKDIKDDFDHGDVLVINEDETMTGVEDNSLQSTVYEELSPVVVRTSTPAHEYIPNMYSSLLPRSPRKTAYNTSTIPAQYQVPNMYSSPLRRSPRKFTQTLTSVPTQYQEPNIYTASKGMYSPRKSMQQQDWTCYGQNFQAATNYFSSSMTSQDSNLNEESFSFPSSALQDKPIDMHTEPAENPKPPTTQTCQIRQKKKDQTDGPKEKELVRLIEGYDVMIDKEDRKTACQKATKANDPGYSLTMKLMYSLFSQEEMASSKGQGLLPGNEEKDPRPPLDKLRLEAIKAFVNGWCHKYSHERPTRNKFTKAISEAVCYSRKRQKKLGKLSD